MSDRNTSEYDCAEVEALLDEYLDGETDAETTRAIEDHLADCESCRDALDERKHARELIATLRADVVPPEGLRERVMADVHADAAAKRRSRIRRVSAVAAAVVLTVGVAAAAAVLPHLEKDSTAGDRIPLKGEAPGGQDVVGGEEDFPENGDWNDAVEDESNVSDGASAVEDGVGASEKLAQSAFETYGGGYDGGHVIVVYDADESAPEQLARKLGVERDGDAVVVAAYTKETMRDADAFLSDIGAVTYRTSCGDVSDGANVCVIVCFYSR